MPYIHIAQVRINTYSAGAAAIACVLLTSVDLSNIGFELELFVDADSSDVRMVASLSLTFAFRCCSIALLYCCLSLPVKASKRSASDDITLSILFIWIMFVLNLERALTCSDQILFNSYRSLMQPPTTLRQ